MKTILPIFFRTMKDRRMTILAYSIAGILFLWMYVSIFPFVQSQAENFQKLLENYPKALMDAFGLEASKLSFNHLENFLAVEQFSFVWPIMAIALVIGFGGSLISGEIEKGTIELLLSQPISRLRIFCEKYLAGFVILLVFTIISVFAVVPLAESYGIDYQIKNYFYIAGLSFIFGLAILSLSAFFSAVFSEKGRVYFVTSGILILMYVLNIIASLKDNLADLKYFSFFYYYNTGKALTEAKIDPWAYLVFIGVFVIFFILTAVWFSKRDI